MGLRLGPGPVFAYEWLTATRRWQLYALRALFILFILAGMAIVQSSMARRGLDGQVSLRDLAAYGEQMYRNVVGIELTLVLLAAPAVTAGAVCLDKARGTLDHMLATDLSNTEIVLGKLGVRLIPVLGLIACTVPTLALAGLLGGIDPLSLLGSFLVSIGCAFVGCALAMTLSVYGRKAHEVLILTYLIVILWLMVPVLVMIAHQVLVGGPRLWSVGTGPWTTLYEWAEVSNPYSLTSAPYSSPGKVGVGTFVGFLAGCLLGAAALTGLATARVRGVALSQAGRPARAGWRLPKLPRLEWLRSRVGPSLDGNPVAWREWHRTRPTTMMRVAWGIYAALGLPCVWMASRPHSGPAGSDGIFMMNMFLVTIGLLLMSVGAATSLAEERARGSLDILLSTPISTRSILAGKWWGSFRGVIWVAIWPAATTIFLVLDCGYWSNYLVLLGLVLAYGATITSLGLALATWVSRLGRAIALCVTAYVALVIGWPMLLVFGLGNHNTAILALILGDPLYGSAFLTMAASSEPLHIPGQPTAEEVFLWGATWLVIHSVAAAMLFRVTLATFDRCLGRTPDDDIPPRSRRPGRSSRSSAELLALVPSSRDEP